ncbi:uncharacterized protein [Penaeus vannamei]|uniref:uncharacterized protein n=1 Tax=Penaeus vannamei TaxID=6689 RepID=UPI00387F8B36
MGFLLYSVAALAFFGLASGAEPWASDSLSADLPGHLFAARDNDVLSALTWATLDLSHLRQDFDHLSAATSFWSLNASSVSSRSLGHSRRRKRRSLSFQINHDINSQLEMRFKIPLFEVIEHTFFMFELPLTYQIDIWQTGSRGHSRNSARGEGGLTEALSQIEDVVSMLGVDGRACVKRTFCELAAGTPLLRPQGLAGEMVQVLVDYLAKSQPPEDTNEVDVGANEYLRASVKGRAGGQCWEAFPECPMSLLNLLNP